MPWRENEGEANVFDKPDEQRSSLLEYAAMARTDDKPSAIRAQLEDGRGAKEEGEAKTKDEIQRFVSEYSERI